MHKEGFNRYLLFILGVMGAVYLRSSWGKITGGEFADGLGTTLSKVVDKNPYPWVKSFLQNVAIPNSELFGVMTMLGELLTAGSLLIAAFYFIFSNKKNLLMVWCLILGSVGGMFLNGVFWLSLGYTSPSTDSLNLVMFMAELAGLVYGVKLLKS